MFTLLIVGKGGARPPIEPPAAQRTTTDDAENLARFFTGDWSSDHGLCAVLKHWTAMRSSDRWHVGQFAEAFSTGNAHLLDRTMEHFAKRFSREQCAELAAVLQRFALGNPHRTSTDNDARMGRARAVADTFDSLTDQEQTDVAAIIVSLAQRNAGTEARNTAATVRANVLRFIRHAFSAADLAKIAKGCIDSMTGNRQPEGGE